MNEADRLQYETQSKDLRLELKTWELDFAKKHNGSKPGRGDIKANPNIASMYKNYNKLRDILSGKIPPPPPPQSKDDVNKDADDTNRKRKSLNPPALTPSSKRFRPAETPLRLIHVTTTAVTPSLSRQLFTPTVPTSIGPTPQRDGRVLGLFDFLPFKHAEIESPSKPKRPARENKAAGSTTNARGHNQDHNAVQENETPRKGKYTIDTGVGIAIDLARTPTSRNSSSSSRPQQQQQPQRTPRKEDKLLATPSHQRHDGNRVAKTPSSTRSSVSRLQFQTPSFLRRIPMPKISEGDEFVSPQPIRLPRKPMVRGLSSILADLRRTEEEHLDDELEALREMENEGTSTQPAGNLSKSKPAPASAPAPAPAPKQTEEPPILDSILAEDTQKQNMNLLGGFDDEALYDSQDDMNEGVDQHGNPLKVYKKKGQKRTTRKANMRPVRTRRTQTGTNPGAAGQAAGGEDEDEDEVVPETQHGASGPAHPNNQEQQDDNNDDQDDPAMLSGSEFGGSEYDDDEDELAMDQPQKLRKPAGRPGSKRQTAPAATTAKKAGDDEKPDGKVKKAARKVNELAHANFKRLKLRNSGAKGGPGFNSRFRRRR
ncbi:hypothetical protein VPNG_06347 [Cytospora leucostoma]|uniref:DNA replication regulator SLD2 n=1 Tax=Cytospora leucostoma TaxID=1230097 RepID=A0A423X2C6_9PEZI|nr:hypothetical protein VPNG_06347 [Cytospora leucostoma]